MIAEQLPLFSLDPRTHARTDDPDTSRAAAHALGDQAARMRRLLAAFAVGPMTAEEAADAAGFGPEEGAWKRVSDLARLGLIADTPQRRTGRSGRAQIVRAITADGLREIGRTP